jgi:uncharacterized protein YbcC (UPF0753/DUF2309 family)
MNPDIIKQAITEASEWINEYWPLNSFIASNPLWEAKHHNIKTVLSKLHNLHGQSGTMPLNFYMDAFKEGKISPDHLKQAIQKNLDSDYLHNDFWLNRSLQQQLCEEIAPMKNLILLSEQLDHAPSGRQKNWVRQQCLQWITPYFDRGEANWLPKTKQSLWAFWCHFIVLEQPKLKPLLQPQQAIEVTIEELLQKIGISSTMLPVYFSRILLELKGYAGLIQWLQRHPENLWLEGNADLITLVAMWLCYEYIIANHSRYNVITISGTAAQSLTWQQWYQANITNTPVPPLDHVDILLTWQTAYEQAYQQSLFEKILHPLAPTIDTRPAVQLIFCMDTRSEGLRRQLEQHPHYQTFGIAGFFGFIFKLNEADTCRLQSPALVSPGDVVSQNAMPQTRLAQAIRAAKTVLENSKNHPISCFGLVEMLSILPAVALWIKEWIPVRHPKQPKIPQYQSHIPFEQAVNSAASLLQTIGLTHNFAQWVVICGHESQSDNNPFASALNCGACGGNSGVPNAVIAAQNLNNPQLRKALRNKGIDIPEETQFIPACHNTTTDAIRWLAPISRNATWHTFQQDLHQASSDLRQERLSSWPNRNKLWRKPFDWAEMIPELGLANNAALIIGPRLFTRCIDLERRCFLHCYDPKSDETGSTLESILCAPAVVAHWINAQYYFSTVNPDFFGAGNKTLHSIVGRIGVVEGNDNDLKTGLPEQSVRFGNQLLHQPQRLLIVVYAPKQRVVDIIQRQPLLQQLIHGHWLSLNVIEPEQPTCAIAIPEF